MTASAQMSAAQLEAEIRSGAPIAILDVRDRAAFAQWQIAAGRAPLVNVPLAEIEADPHRSVAAAGLGGRELRVLCTRGRSSADAMTLLRDAGIVATGVEGGMIPWSRLLTCDVVSLTARTAVAQFRREARGCLSYLLASGGEGLVVDPAPEVGAYVAQADHLGIRITHVLDTHVHADHLSGMRSLAVATDATMHLSSGAIMRGADVTGVVAVGEGDRIEVGDSDLRIVELPGHTSDNVGILVDAAAIIPATRSSPTPLHARTWRSGTPERWTRRGSCTARSTTGCCDSATTCCFSRATTAGAAVRHQSPRHWAR